MYTQQFLSSTDAVNPLTLDQLPSCDKELSTQDRKVQELKLKIACLKSEKQQLSDKLAHKKNKYQRLKAQFLSLSHSDYDVVKISSTQFNSCPNLEFPPVDLRLSMLEGESYGNRLYMDNEGSSDDRELNETINLLSDSILMMQESGIFDSPPMQLESDLVGVDPNTTTDLLRDFEADCVMCENDLSDDASSATVRMNLEELNTAIQNACHAMSGGLFFKIRTREYIWKEEPSLLLKGARWERNQIENIEKAMPILVRAYKLLKEMEKNSADYTNEQVVNAMKKACFDEEIEKFEPLLESTLHDKNTFRELTAADLIRKFKILLELKKEQFKRSKKELEQRLIEKIKTRENDQSVVEHERSIAAAEADHIKSKTDQEKRRVKAEFIALDMLWEALKNSKIEKMRINFEIQKTWTPDSPREWLERQGGKWSFKNIALICKEGYIPLYLTNLRAHPEYASLLKEFASHLEEGLTK